MALDVIENLTGRTFQRRESHKQRCEGGVDREAEKLVTGRKSCCHLPLKASRVLLTAEVKRDA